MTRRPSSEVVKRMSKEELATLDAAIRQADKLIGDRRKLQQQIPFTDRRTTGERRKGSK